MPAHNPPKPLPTGRYVGAVIGLCFFCAVIGAGAKSVAEDVGTPAGVWGAWTVAFLLGTGATALFARYVGNPTAWIIGGVLFGMGTEHLGEELGNLAGGVWVRVLRLAFFFLGYLLWVLVIHHRIAGRPNPVVPAWGRRA